MLANWPLFRDLCGAVALGLGAWVAMTFGLDGYSCCHNPGWKVIAGYSIFRPAVEELIFRGVLQSELSATDWGKRGQYFTYANLATSLCFAALHIPFRSIEWALATFFPSLVFGYFRDRHKSLVWPIAVHGFYNMGLLYISP